MPEVRKTIVPRVVSVSDVCPKKDLYHDPCDVIIMSRMAVSEFVDSIWDQ